MVDVLYDKKLRCLYCDANFITKRVRQSRVRLIKRDADFCHQYEGENPYFYEVNVCPHCGFAFTDSFSPLRPEKKEAIKKEYLARIEVLDLCGPRKPQAALLSFKLGLLFANFLEEPMTTIAGLLMRIAWFWRYQGKEEEEKKYLAKALEVYEKTYLTQDLDRLPMGKTKLIYLIAELNGRLGKYEEARRWFNMLFSEKNVAPSLNKLAREQWEEYKALLKSS